MASRSQFSLVPVSDADGIATAQTPGGSGNLTLDGALTSGGTLTLSDAHIVTITSDANDSGVTFTITGTDSRDVSISEVVTGPNTTTVLSTKYFKTVSQIVISGAGTGNITVGVNGESVTPWFVVNRGEDNVSISITSILSTGGLLTYSEQHTVDDIQQNSDITINTIEHDIMVDKTTSFDSNIAFPIIASQIVVKAFTNGNLIVTYLQAS